MEILGRYRQKKKPTSGGNVTFCCGTSKYPVEIYKQRDQIVKDFKKPKCYLINMIILYDINILSKEIHKVSSFKQLEMEIAFKFSYQFTWTQESWNE